MGKYNNEKNNPRLIKKIATARSLCSIIAPDPKSNYDNVVLEFVEFDSKTFKKSKEVDIYFPLDEFLGFCQMIIDRTVLNGIKADTASMQARGLKYSDARLFFRRGGGKERVGDVTVLKYREFYLQASSKEKNGVVFVAEKCDGIEKDGLINPKKGYPGKETVRVMMDYGTLFNTACLCQSRINAYFVAKQLSGAYERPQTNAEPVAEEVNNTPVVQYETQMIPQQEEPQQVDMNTFVGVQEIDPEEAFFIAHNAQYSQ